MPEHKWGPCLLTFHPRPIGDPAHFQEDCRMNTKILVYLTDEEKNVIQSAAKEASVSMSTFIRLAALKEAKR